jgi:hypothetical protein
MHRRYRHRLHDLDRRQGLNPDVVGSFHRRQVLHLGEVIRNQDAVRHRLRQDVVHLDAVRHRLRQDVVHLDAVRRQSVTVRTDCFHPDDLPDEEFPFPDSPQMGCYQVEECQGLVKEELGLAKLESEPLGSLPQALRSELLPSKF